MPLNKPIKDLKVSILVPCYKRPEYTQKCVKAIYQAQKYGDNVTFHLVDDGSNDGTKEILKASMLNLKLNSKVKTYKYSKGLRKVIIDFFKEVREQDVDIIAKIDNDCEVPPEWLNDILKVFTKAPVGILSPNVYPSNAAYKYGTEDMMGYGFRPAEVVGGLWVMKKSLIEDMDFEEHDVGGLKGAVPILRQIVNENDPIMGWVASVTFQDIGHWSGMHPNHIKTKDHEEYYSEVGRDIAWNA